MSAADPVALAISFGGSKIAAALVDCEARALVARSERIEWRPLTGSMEGLLGLIASSVPPLLARGNRSPNQITLVGIAWPGPGHYSRGLVQATFLPGFIRETSIFDPLDQALRAMLGVSWCPLGWQVQLDAAARAAGERSLPRGGLNDIANGTVLNVATGIAGAFVAGGTVMRHLAGLGETYGQWGRYLIWHRSRSEWEWRPTLDGSIPKLDTNNEVRFTDMCGGPAIARRFVEHCDSADPELRNVLESVRALKGRSVTLERQLLSRISSCAIAGDSAASAFVREIAELVGSAMARLASSVGSLGERVVLAGGIGELFAKPSTGTDDFIVAAHNASRQHNCHWVRSTLGLESELVGAVL